MALTLAKYIFKDIDIFFEKKSWCEWSTDELLKNVLKHLYELG